MSTKANSRPTAGRRRVELTLVGVKNHAGFLMRAHGDPQLSRDDNRTARFMGIDNHLFAVPPQHQIDVAFLQHDNFISHRVHLPYPPDFAEAVQHDQYMAGKNI